MRTIAIAELKTKRQEWRKMADMRKNKHAERGNLHGVQNIERWEAQLAGWDTAIAELETGKVVPAERLIDGIRLLLGLSGERVTIAKHQDAFEIW